MQDARMSRWSLGHRRGLDGLRGVAVGLVVACHAFKGHFDNLGPVGVTTFFALSGFLITSLLLEERESTGRVSFGGFYARRVRRLLPALFVYLAVWTVAGSFIDKIEFKVRSIDLIATALYFQNWRLATFHNVSWPTAITWTLSIEEQFYLLWPLTFLLLKRWPRAQIGVAITGIAFSAALRVATWDGSGANAWAMYHQTATNIDPIFLGCLLAIAVHRVSLRVPRWVAPAAVAAVIAIALVDDYMLNHVALPFVVAVAACGVIATTCVRRVVVLELAPLVWLGKRSYALYLWHYPLVTLIGEHHPAAAKLGAIALSLVAAELSWRLVERPAQRFRRRSGDAEEVELSLDAAPR